MAGADTSNRDVWSELIEIARWAPSPHNTQPWAVRRIDETHADLLMIGSRRLPDEDTTGCFIVCAMGIFIETMRIAAANRGWRLSARSVDELDVRRELIPFAFLVLEPGAPPSEFGDDSILNRRTARLPARSSRLPAAAERRLAAIAESHGHRLHVIDDARRIDDMLAANVDAVLHDLSDHRYGAEIKRWYRYTRRQARDRADGLSAECMHIPGLQLWLSAQCPWLMRTPGLRSILRMIYRRQLGPADRLLCLSGPFFERRAAERAGIMLMQFWLALHEAGGGMHPFGNLVTNPIAHARMIEVTGIEDPWLVARFGPTRAAPRSHRRTTEDILHAGNPG